MRAGRRPPPRPRAEAQAAPPQRAGGGRAGAKRADLTEPDGGTQADMPVLRHAACPRRQTGLHGAWLGRGTSASSAARNSWVWACGRHPRRDNQEPGEQPDSQARDFGRCGPELGWGVGGIAEPTAWSFGLGMGLGLGLGCRGLGSGFQVFTVCSGKG
jgi:hypothetical protein